MPEPTATDCLRFLALAARESLKLSQADDFNKAVTTIESLIKASAEKPDDSAKKPE